MLNKIEYLVRIRQFSDLAKCTTHIIIDWNKKSLQGKNKDCAQRKQSFLSAILDVVFLYIRVPFTNEAVRIFDVPSSQRKQQKDLLAALQKVVVPIYCTSFLAVEEDKQQRITRVRVCRHLKHVHGQQSF